MVIPLALGLMLVLAELNTTNALRPAFQPSQFAVADVPQRCPSEIRPMIDMSDIRSFYRNDRTQSVIDPRAMRLFMMQTEDITKIKRVLLDLQLVYLAGDARSADAGGCLARQLKAWANAGAMLGSLAADPAMRRQGVMLIVWTSIAITNAYTLVSESGAVKRDAFVIKQWLGRLQARIMREFEPDIGRPQRLQWLNGTANHSNAAGLAVGLIAAVNGDREGFQWAMAELRRTLAAAEPEGGLSPELGRGKRALHYQSFAMIHIAWLVALADANGVVFSAKEEAKLIAMARFTLAVYRDPSILARRTGKPQEKKPGMANWMEVLLPHMRRTDLELARAMDAELAPLRPIDAVYQSAPLTALFRAGP